MTKELMEKYRI